MNKKTVEVPRKDFSGSTLLGLLALVVLGPLVLAGGFVFIAVVLDMSLGVEIGWLTRRTPIDFLYDPGWPLFPNQGIGFVHYAAMMIGGLTAGLGTYGIWWSFTGRRLF